MNTITLESLTLREFQGATFTLVANGQSVDVLADNGIGKTRLASAWTWLISGRDSLGRTEFEIKNKDLSGETLHGLEHAVEAVLNVNDKRVKLGKIYKERWERKRGSATETFTGHENKYFIDEIPVGEKEFNDRLTEIVGDREVFSLLTSPMAFPNMPDKGKVQGWKRQRAILLDVCGDLSDSDVIASDNKLSPLLAVLEKHTLSKNPIDDHKKIVAANREKINGELKSLPVRIDEQRRSLPDVSGLARHPLDSQIAGITKAIADTQLKLSGVDNGGAVADLTRQLAGVNADIQKLEASHFSTTMQTVNRLEQRVSEITAAVNAARRRISMLSGELSAKAKRPESIEAELQKLRTQWSVIDSETFHDSTECTCAACGQALPADRVASAREKALSDFNQRKAERLADNTRRGKDLSSEKERLVAELETLRTELSGEEVKVNAMEAELKQATSERNQEKQLATDYTVLPERDELVARRTEIEAAIQAERSGRASDSEPLRTELRELETRLSAAKSAVDKFTRLEQGEARIAELMAQEKGLAGEFERLEHELYLCEQFIRAKVAMLTDRINAKFRTVRFRLFKEQVNGGLEECCEITVGGVPYNGGLNNAARINAGMEVCDVLADHYGLRAPIFVDNSESVTRLADVGAQVIRLIVSEQDKTLRVEYAREAVAA